MNWYPLINTFLPQTDQARALAQIQAQLPLFSREELLQLQAALALALKDTAPAEPPPPPAPAPELGWR